MLLRSEELLRHCRETITNQRPSNNVERAVINGETVGDNGEAVILHEHVMRLMMETCAPLCKSNIVALRDHANGIRRHRGKRMFSRVCTGPGKFAFPQMVTRSSTCRAAVGIVIICYMIYMFRKSTLMSILPMVHEGVR